MFSIPGKSPVTLTPGAASPIGQRKQARLREIAARASLEYFNRIPPPLSGALRDPWQNVEARATQVTSTLDDILHHLPPPTHYGLNE